MTLKKNSSEKEERQFVKETIANSKRRGKRTLKKFFATVLSAVVFGIVAALVIVFVLPLFGIKPDLEASKPSPVIIFESSSAPETEETTAETEAESETETEDADSNAIALWTTIKPFVQGEIEGSIEGIEGTDFNEAARRDVISKVNRSIVTISAQNATTDWFDNDVTQREERSGVIVAITESEILILTDTKIVSGNQTIFAVFANSLQMPARVKGVDNSYGLAILSVNKNAWSRTQLEGISALEMGNSMGAVQGQTVMAVGAPMGKVRSAVSGEITGTSQNVQGTDTSSKLLHTNIAVPGSSNGLLVDMKGKMIGWITNLYPDECIDGFASAITLHNISLSLEKLCNGNALALLGVLGQTISPSMAEAYDLPRGIYINRSAPDTPADYAGIQGGDILATIDGQEVGTYNDFTAIMSEKNPGDKAVVTIMRRGSSGYVEKEIELELGSR